MLDIGMLSKKSDLEETISKLENEMGLPQGFLQSLQSEDDWSFVIKTHAFLEALLSHVLIKSVGNDELLDIFSGLEMSNSRTGKIAFAKALGVIDKEGFRFIQNFSELRNRLVHNIGEINFSFSEYISKMGKDKFGSFVNAFAYFASVEDLVANRKTVNELLKTDPKLSIWISVVHFAGVIY